MSQIATVSLERWSTCALEIKYHTKEETKNQIVEGVQNIHLHHILQLTYYGDLLSTILYFKHALTHTELPTTQIYDESMCTDFVYQTAMIAHPQTNAHMQNVVKNYRYIYE